MTENEILRSNQLKDLKVGMDKITLDGDNISPSGNASDVEERFNILMEENSLMAEQNALLSNELERSQEEIMQREQNIINLTQSMSDAAAAMQQLESEIATTQSEKKECEAALMMKTNECLSHEEVAKKAVADAKTASDKKNEVLISLEELRNDNKELDKECNDLAGKARLAASKMNNLNGKLSAKTIEVDRLSDSLRRATTELARVRNDAENMVSVMDGMEKQLTEFQSREEGVSQLSR